MTFKSKDTYNNYKNKSKNPLPYSEYCIILSEFNKLLIHYILNESCEVKLPHHLGYIRVRKYKVNVGKYLSNQGSRLPVDWVATKELWETNIKAKEAKKLVLHMNEHRLGYTYKIFWGKDRANVRNKTGYYLKPARAFKRELANILINNPEIEYYE
jgi:hypothetical protein